MPDDFVVRVVDDDEAVRLSFGMLLEASGYAVRSYCSAEDILAALRAGVVPPDPGCALVDVHMPGGTDGLALLDALRRSYPTLPVVVITGRGEISMAVRAIRAGALNFIEKPYDEEQLLVAIATARKHGHDAFAAERRRSDAAFRIASLAPRERDVLRLLVAGLPNKLIAHEIGISPRTVENHRASMMARLGVSSLAEAVRIALSASHDDPASTWPL